MANCWSVSNYTSHVTFAVENLEGGAELIKIAPRRKDVIVPFEMSRLLIPSGSRLVEIKIFGQSPTFLAPEEPVGEMATPSLLLDPKSKYFQVLVALCEPRLRGSTMAPVPSVQEVVNRLREGQSFRNATRSSINYHIDYLHLHKLPHATAGLISATRRLHSKREALVYFALRHDLVREEHLALLPTARHRLAE